MRQQLLAVLATSLIAAAASGGENYPDKSRANTAAFPSSIQGLVALIGEDGAKAFEHLKQFDFDATISLPRACLENTEFAKCGTRPTIYYFVEKGKIGSVLILARLGDNSKGQITDFAERCKKSGEIVYSWDEWDAKRKIATPEYIEHLSRTEPEMAAKLKTRNPEWFLIKPLKGGHIFSLDTRPLIKESNAAVHFPANLSDSEIGPIPSDVEKEVKADSLPAATQPIDPKEWMGLPIPLGDKASSVFNVISSRRLDFCVRVRSPFRMCVAPGYFANISVAEFLFKNGKFYGGYWLIEHDRSEQKPLPQIEELFGKENVLSKYRKDEKTRLVFKMDNREINCLGSVDRDGMALALFPKDGSAPEGGVSFDDFVDPLDLDTDTCKILLDYRIKITSSIMLNKSDPDLYIKRAFLYVLRGDYPKADSDIETCKKMGGPVKMDLYEKLKKMYPRANSN